ncbi:hypothetical protein GLOIN_2v1522835 [Rhizophagus irregularis DAOM 181602=DAOM 197198]|nr:hypothetical protein GLOIN_2v1522835 [Rhizophagus irregularis DAOM 181602=DAOM 197198]
MSRMNKLFFCIPQEIGPIIIPLLWLISGVIVIVKFTLDFCSSVKGTNMFAYSSVYTILIMAICGLTIIGAAIILYILVCLKTPYMISVYFKITVVIGIIIIMGAFCCVVALQGTVFSIILNWFETLNYNHNYICITVLTIIGILY